MGLAEVAGLHRSESARDGTTRTAPTTMGGGGEQARQDILEECALSMFHVPCQPPPPRSKSGVEKVRYTKSPCLNYHKNTNRIMAQ